MVLPAILLIIVYGLLGLTAIRPHDYFTWFLGVLPILLATPILVISCNRFKFTSLVYVLIAIHCLILMLGGHYTYAEVPFGYWLKDVFDLSRNPYDRIGHFAQGFIPAMIARELLLRTSPLVPGKWLVFLTSFWREKRQKLSRA